MNKLEKKIQHQKNVIYFKKRHLERDIKAAKQRLASPANLGITALGGFILGYLFLPKKLKTIRTVLKVLTLATTAKQITDRLISLSETTTKTKQNNSIHR